MRFGAGSRRGTARRGEALAALFLRLKGYRIEARNWRCPLGEIDIVAWDRDTLVFVEVKARTGTSAGAPEDGRGSPQTGVPRCSAQAFLTRRRGATPPCRFDVIAIAGGRFLPRVRHLRAAFRADDLV